MMSSDGELYINEDCRDAFQKELDKAFGRGKWALDAGQYSNYWDMSKFPEKAKVDVIDAETREKNIGQVEITSKPYINGTYYGRLIEMEPKKIKILSKIKVM